MPTENWTDERLDKLAELVEKNSKAIDKLTTDIETQREESKEQQIRFTYYQQSTQTLTSLAFSLIAAATITTIVSTVFNR